MMDLNAVESATQALVEQGVRVFNGALFGEDEASHVDLLLHAMSPIPGAVVVDAGCGVGGMAALMGARRPDLKFILVNVSAVQLGHCPPGTSLIQADFDAMPLADASADVVVFSYAICHSADWVVTLREARRVLKPGGVLLINDMLRLEGDSEEFERVLGARVHYPEQIEAWARQAGFGLQWALAPEVKVSRLADMLPAEQAARLFRGVIPTVWRFEALDDVAAAFQRHERVGFQFSGGRDSTAALYLLQPYWERMAVYHLDTGDQFPETRDVVARVRADLEAAGASLTVIRTDVHAQREALGYPSDLVPVDNAGIGRLVSGAPMKLRGRYECCAAALMLPMHERMLADGVTLLVRGQRDDEYATPPMRSGDADGVVEVLYPIQDWTGEQVSAFLRENALPLAPYYERGARRAPECMGCTAWWDEGRAHYMRDHHPKEHVVLVRRLADIQAEINRQFDWLNHEMEN